MRTNCRADSLRASQRPLSFAEGPLAETVNETICGRDTKGADGNSEQSTEQQPHERKSDAMCSDSDFAGKNLQAPGVTPACDGARRLSA